MRMVMVAAALAGSIGSEGGWAFDAEGFESGMKVTAFLKAVNDRYRSVVNEHEFFIATEPLAPDDPESMQFWFCRNRLFMVTARSDVDLSVRNLLALVDDQIKARGQPLRVETRASLHGGIGELRELTFIWNTRPDYFNVTFEYYETEKGDVSHAWFAENDCLRPLWMRGIDGGTGEARLTAPEAFARN